MIWKLLKSVITIRKEMWVSLSYARSHTPRLFLKILPCCHALRLFFWVSGTKMSVEGYVNQLMQIVYTATSFSTVNSVQFLIEGEKREYLGSEGQWIALHFQEVHSKIELFVRFYNFIKVRLVCGIYI